MYIRVSGLYPDKYVTPVAGYKLMMLSADIRVRQDEEQVECLPDEEEGRDHPDKAAGWLPSDPYPKLCRRQCNLHAFSRLDFMSL